MRWPFKLVRKLPKKLDLPKDLFALISNRNVKRTYPLVIEVDYLKLCVLAGATEAALKDGEDMTIELMAGALFETGFARHMMQAFKKSEKGDKEKSLDYFT